MKFTLCGNTYQCQKEINSLLGDTVSTDLPRELDTDLQDIIMRSVPSNLATLSPDLSSVYTTNVLVSSLLHVDAGPNIAKIIRKERQKHRLDDDLSKF